MNKNKLYGAILGDLAGQPYEFGYTGDYSEFNIHDPRSKFTDDTIMTLATASVFLENDIHHIRQREFEIAYKAFGLKYEGDYYGSKFKQWLKLPKETIGTSWGNGALMRVTPVYYVFQDSYRQLITALDSAFTSHFSPEVYTCIRRHQFYFHNVNVYDYPEEVIKDMEIPRFDKFDSSSAGTMDFIGLIARKCKTTHEAIETCIQAGGDTDTNASIAGEIFSNFRKDLTQDDIDYVESKLDPFLFTILKKFNQKFK